jgi:hypothetical protein
MGVWLGILSIAAGAVLLAGFVTKVLVPLGRLIRTTVHLLDMHTTLVDIAKEFEPNDGTSLRDVVDGMVKGQQQLRDDVTCLANKVDTYLLERRPNGRRKTDPRA